MQETFEYLEMLEKLYKKDFINLKMYYEIKEKIIDNFKKEM